MDQPLQPASGNSRARVDFVLGGVTFAFLGLAGLFLANLWGRPPPRQDIPLVDPSVLDATPFRQSYADLVRAKEDLSDFDCYACHDKRTPPTLKFDENHSIIIPDEHENIEMSHGPHHRNDVCFNCHNEQNLLTFQARDGRELRFQDSSALCGSCHGPTFRDWEAGVHGRTSGYWDRTKGEALRLDCVNCHDPHSPQIPTLQPAPGPYQLRPDPRPPKTKQPTH
jgi:hypothetical protein